jgi:hypothetical protein
MALIIVMAFVGDAADAKCVCKRNKGDANTDALGEEFPEVTNPSASADTDALGEEFPE